MRNAFWALILLPVIGAANTLPATCQSKTELLGRSKPSPRAVPVLAPIGLSKETKALATSMGLLDKIDRLQALKSIESPTTDQKVEAMLLQQECSDAVQLASCEVRAVTARIDRESANANEILAYLAERRDRAVRLNTYADFISGGITGVISSALKIGDVVGPSADIIDATEGALQTGLASWAFQQQRGERRKMQGVPSLLNHLFQQKSVAQQDYPPAVWAFLTNPLPGNPSNACRLDVLVDRWKKLGVCLTHKSHRGQPEKHLQHASGHPDSTKITIDVLEDRTAMLTDLRATVVEMDVELLELMQAVMGVRSTSPKPDVEVP